MAPSVAPRWPRPSVFQAGHIRSWRESRECYALSTVASVSGWVLLLLSPLLSATGPVPPLPRATGRRQRDALVLAAISRPVSGNPVAPVLSQSPPPNPMAAEP